MALETFENDDVEFFLFFCLANFVHLSKVYRASLCCCAAVVMLSEKWNSFMWNFRLFLII